MIALLNERSSAAVCPVQIARFGSGFIRCGGSRLGFEGELKSGSPVMVASGQMKGQGVTPKTRYFRLKASPSGVARHVVRWLSNTTTENRFAKRFGRRSASVGLSGVIAVTGIAAGGLIDDATAIGDSRSLSLYYTHTKDTLNITYKRNGYYDRDALKQLSYFLRDWRHDEPTDMDPKLFDVLWEVYREAGHEGDTINVVSAYRSPETNAMLRRRSRAVAKFSQHMLGKAMDTTMPGVSMSTIREIGVRLQRGGVGYYPTAGTPFVHLDVGGVRAWPRMSTSQLVALFPDQKTVHLPSDGPPLAGYQEALAEIQRNGGSAGGGGEEEESTGISLLAALFGGGKSSAPSRGTQVASRSSGGGQQLAYAPSGGDDTGVRAFLATDGIAPKTEPVQVQRGRTARVKIENPIVVASNAPEPAVVTVPPPVSPVVAQAAARTGSPAESFPASAVTQDVALAKDAVSKDSAVPLPPKRPTDLLVASLTPLPPTRPPELGSAAPRLELASAAPSEGRAVPLPPLLERPRLPSQALGYAATANVASFIPVPPLRGTSPAQPPAPAVPLVPVARAEQRQASLSPRLPTSGTVVDSSSQSKKPQPIQVAALVKDGIVATRFQAATPRLESGRFAQGMTQPLGASFVKRDLD